MAEGGPGELGSVFVNVVPSLSGAEDAIKAGAAQAAETFAKEFNSRLGPAMGQGSSSLGQTVANNLLSHVAGPFKDILEKVGVDFKKGLGEIGAEGGAAMGAGVAAGVLLGAHQMKENIQNLVKLAETEFKQFSRVGTEAAETLLSGFKSVVSGQMPDVMQAFDVVEEATRTSLELPFNVVSTAVDNTIGRIPVLGGVVKSELGAVESAFGGLFGVFDKFKELGGEWLEQITEIGDQYIEASRKIAGTTLDTGQIDHLTDVVRDIMASGAVVHFDDVTEAIGRLNTNIKGLSTEQLKELTTTLAEGEELVGHIDVTKFSGLVNAFGIPADKANEALTRLVNTVRATGVPMNELLGEMTRSGPAMRALGYDADQTSAFFAAMTAQGEKGTRLIFGLSDALKKIDDLVAQGTFKNAKDGMTRLIEVTREYVKAGNEAGALDFLGKFFTPNTAPLVLEDIKNHVLDTADAMKGLAGTDQELGKAVEDTKSLGDAMEIVGHQIKAALSPIGTELAHSLIEASGHISTWLKDNQAKIGGWAVDITRFFINGMSQAATFMFDTLALFGPILEAFKDMVSGAVQFVINAFYPLVAIGSHLPGWAGGDVFRDMRKGMDETRTLMQKAWNFDLPKVLHDAAAQVHDFDKNTLPELNKSLDDTKRRMSWYGDKWFGEGAEKGAPGGTPDTGDGSGSPDTATSSGTGDTGSTTDTSTLPPLSSYKPVPVTGGPAGGYSVPSASVPLQAPPPTAAPNTRLRAGDYPLGQSVDGVALPPVPISGMTLQQYREWATRATHYAQEGADLATEQQQAQTDISQKAGAYNKLLDATHQLEAQIAKMAPDDPTRQAAQEKLDKQHEKLQEALTAVKDATDRLTKVQQRAADRDIQGPPTPPGADKTKDSNTDAEALGKGLVKGIAQELGFDGVFKNLTGGALKAPWEWTGPKTALSILGDLLGIGGRGGMPVHVQNWPQALGGTGVGYGGVPLVPIGGPTAGWPNFGGFPAIIPGTPSFAGPPVHGGKPPDALPGPLGPGKANTAAYIVSQAQARGFTPEQTVAVLSTALQESGLSEGAQGGGGAWHGIFQQDASYPGRDTVAGNVSGFFDRLGAPGGDIWRQIFALQQGRAYGSPGARNAYLGEIQSQQGAAQSLYDQVVGGGAAPSGFAGGGGFNPATMASSLGGASVTYTPDFLRQHGVAPVFEKRYGSDVADAPPWVQQMAAAFGLSVTDHPDTTLHGGQAGRGNTIDPMGSWAFDFSGPVENEQRFADYIRANLAPQTLQAIWQNPNTGQQLGIAGGQILGPGQYYTGSEGYSAHTDHVHWATDVPPMLPGLAAPAVPMPRVPMPSVPGPGGGAGSAMGAAFAAAGGILNAFTQEGAAVFAVTHPNQHLGDPPTPRAGQAHPQVWNAPPVAAKVVGAMTPASAPDTTGSTGRPGAGTTVNVDASGLMHPAEVAHAIMPHITPGATASSPAPPPALVGGAGIPA